MNINSALGVTLIATFLSLAATISLFSSATAFAQENAQENQQYSFVKKWGSEGIGFGRFAQPIDIAIDSSGNLYVTDLSSMSNKIQKFTSNGTFITAWGNLGFGPGRFTSPAGIDVGTLDNNNNVYIADIGSPGTAVQVFTINGTFIRSWGSDGLGDGQFINPAGIAVDSSGNVYVGDFGENNRIQKFDSNGNFITKWGSIGSNDGQFNRPSGLAVDSSGNVYVADEDNNRIQKFDSNGNFITKWGSPGNKDGQFLGPSGLIVDPSGNVYVVDGVIAVYRYSLLHRTA